MTNEHSGEGSCTCGIPLNFFKSHLLELRWHKYQYQTPQNIMLSLSIHILTQCKGENADLCYVIISFTIFNSKNKGISSCVEILLLYYTEEKRGHSHRSSSHLLFILLGEARRSYSCAQRKQAWPLCQMASELSEVIKQLGEYKAFLSESCSSFSCLKYDREFLSPFVTNVSTSEELILPYKSQTFPLQWVF